MRNRPIGIFLLLLTGLVPVLSAKENVGSVTPIQHSTAEEEAPSKINIDFEDYQKNIDDLFRISLMTHQDSDFGINSIIVNLNRRLAKRPEDPETLMGLGHVYRILGQPGEANRFYEKAIEFAPDDFHLNVFSAKMFYQEQELQKAVERIDAALKVNPEDASIWDIRGGLFLKMGKEEEALESFEQAHRLDPDRQTVLFALSVLYQRLGRVDEALTLLEMLAEQHPGDTYLKYNLGALLFARGRSGEALKLWEEIFYEGVRAPKFLFNLVLAYLEAENYEKAENLLNHLRFFFPRELDVDFLVAEAHRQMGNLDEAESKYREILALENDYVSAYIGLALVLEAKGDVDASRAAIARSREIMTQKQMETEALKEPQDVHSFLKQKLGEA